jgi:DNA invertase Pin-like site-specific DNA recombinase
MPDLEFLIDKCIHINIIGRRNGKIQGLLDPITRYRHIMKAVGYTRVSTEDQVKEGISLDAQKAKIEAYASINSLELLEIICDEGASGKSLEREGIVRLLELVDAGEVVAVIVYKLDRLSRKTLDTLSLIESFESKDIAFHSISERVDTKSATGRFFLTILSAIAQMERDMIAERTKDALAHKKQKGEWVGRVPFGFRIQNNTLLEDPEQIKVIQKAKRLRRSGKSLREISRALSLSLGYVHKALKINLRTVKANYSIDL